MYFSFDSKDKGSYKANTCKFIHFHVTNLLFHINTPGYERFYIFLSELTIGAACYFTYLCQQREYLMIK